MPNANEKLLRDAYAAFAKGDMPAFVALCAPSITFTVPGEGLLSGRHARDEFFGKLGPAMGAVAGSFREEIVRLVAGEREGVVWTAQRADRDGRTHRWNAVHWWEIADGKLVSFTELVDDAASFGAAWHR
jgi:ketosteroid isomerase-like protein